MTEAERFRKEAEERLREAERVLSPLDRESWLCMAKQWSKLAREAEQRREPSKPSAAVIDACQI